MKIENKVAKARPLKSTDFKVGQVGRLVGVIGGIDDSFVGETGDVVLFGTTSVRGDVPEPRFGVNLRTGFVFDGLLREAVFERVEAKVVVE